MVVNAWLFVFAIALLALALLGVLLQCLFDAVTAYRHNKAQEAYLKKGKSW